MPSDVPQPPRGDARRPRILLAMIAAGGGHRAAARALEAGFLRAFPDRFEVVVSDFMAEVGEVALDRRHKESWRWLLQHPRYAYLGQRVLDAAVPPAVMGAVQDGVLRSFSRAAAAWLRDQAIDLAVCVHFMPMRALAAAARRGEVRVPVIGMNTELFDGNVLWAEPRVDELMVATEASRLRLLGRGVPAGRVSVVGYPIHPKFLDASPDQAATRARLGLEPGRLTAVHVAGGEGIGGLLEATARRVLRAPADIRYVTICGGNDALRTQLEALAAEAPPGTLTVRGFVDDLQDWIVASDVVVGKAGPGVTVEALTLGRPIFHTSFAADNEKQNVDFCVAAGVGRYLPEPGALVDALLALDRDRAALRALQERARAHAPAPGTEVAVRRLAARLGAGPRAGAA